MYNILTAREFARAMGEDRVESRYHDDKYPRKSRSGVTDGILIQRERERGREGKVRWHVMQFVPDAYEEHIRCDPSEKTFIDRPRKLLSII